MVVPCWRRCGGAAITVRMLPGGGRQLSGPTGSLWEVKSPSAICEEAFGEIQMEDTVEEGRSAGALVAYCKVTSSCQRPEGAD